MKSAVAFMMLPFFASVIACAPQEAVMTSHKEDPKAALNEAAVAPPLVMISEAEAPLVGTTADSSAEAVGRRILSTAFVQVGADGHLTIELRNGRVLVLRNVVMRRNDYCGVQVLGGPAGKTYCGGYREVVGARAGGGPNTK